VRIVGWIIAGAVVLAGSFFVTLQVLDRYFPSYDADFPRIIPGRVLTFKNGENRGALISGWSGSEDWGVWSDANEAQLGFVVLGIDAQNATINVECRANVSPQVPEQKVEIWSRNIKLGEVTLKTNINNFSVGLGGLDLGETHPLVLLLRIPFATHAGADSRKLGIGLISIRFES
jgi:hypothetical protein